LLVVYEIYTIAEGMKHNLMKEVYYKSSYLVTNYVITNYMDKKILKSSINAKSISYKYYLPEKLFPSGFILVTRNISENKEIKKYLVMYSYDLPQIFKMSYNLNKDFFAHQGINKDKISDKSE
jgi:hypothetical protein